MAAQALFAPLPRAIEANGWVSPVNVITMPTLSSIRGVHPVVLSGSPMCFNAEAKLTWVNFQSNPMTLFLHGVAACESFFTGLFELLTATGEPFYDVMAYLGIDGQMDRTPMRLFYEAVAYRFGGSKTVRWYTSAGVDFVRHLEETQFAQCPVTVSAIANHPDGYQFYEIEEAGIKRTRIRTPEMRPALYPILSMGVNVDHYYPNAWAYSVDLAYDSNTHAYTVLGSSLANKALNALRVVGYDAILTNAVSGMKYRNWAANANGHVMPMVPPDSGNGMYYIRVDDISVRRHHWVELPVGQGNIQLKLKLKPTSYAIMLSGKLLTNYAGTRKLITHVPQPLQGYSFGGVVFQTTSTNLPYRGKHFQLARGVDDSTSMSRVTNESQQPQEQLDAELPLNTPLESAEAQE
nr:MAG: capsid protein [Hanko totivirus 1]